MGYYFEHVYYIQFHAVITVKVSFDNMILTGLILATIRPGAVAFASATFVMDTNFQRPVDYDETLCKAQHEKGRSQIK